MFGLQNQAMQLTQAQYEKLAHCLPVQRGNVTLSNLQMRNAILYVVGHCLPNGAACPSIRATGTLV